MPNATLKPVNAKPFNPDKGLPLIAIRPGQSIGKGAAKEATTNHQVKK